ncbi:MAG: hypothetical protein WC861_03275 [Candidatus Micrarchaeia archaeon]|jgi:hypothetical protein
MATNHAKGRKRADKQAKGARAQGIGARPQGQGARSLEKGICIICGSARAGAPAKPEFPIIAARKLRALFRQPARHTVACSEHLGEASARRARFEKKVRDYLLAAALFFVLVVAGGFYFGNGEFRLFMPALLGAIIIAVLPFFYYFPSFGK